MVNGVMHHDSMDHPESDPDAKKVVCYFTSWAYYRRGEGKFTPADIEADLCTHIVYAYASLDPDEGTSVISQDTGVDFDRGYYKGVTGLRSRGKKVMLALGGWVDSARSSDKYSAMVNDPGVMTNLFFIKLVFSR